MPDTLLPSPKVNGLTSFELSAADEPALQAFFEANPGYFHAVNGDAPGPMAAHEEIHAELPAGWAFTKHWLIGYRDQSQALQAFANVTSDLLAPSVWHIGLFLVATSRHGSGDAHGLFRGIEAWAQCQGAQWLRLGVVMGNTRAERFWLTHGFTQSRLREGVEMGKRVNTVSVMVKPLAHRTLAQYLELVARDRPDED